MMQTTQIADDANTAYASENIDAGAHLIPSHMVGSVKRYLLDGIAPGSFLTAVLSNDFMGAAAKADDDNAAALMGWARFLYNHMPSGSFGSPARFDAIIKDGGFRGRARAKAA